MVVESIVGTPFVICASVRSNVPIALAVSLAVGVTLVPDAENVVPTRLAVDEAPKVLTETIFWIE